MNEMTNHPSFGRGTITGSGSSCTEKDLASIADGLVDYEIVGGTVRLIWGPKQVEEFATIQAAIDHLQKAR